MAERSTESMRYTGKSHTVMSFLSIHRELTHAIHAICPVQGPDAFKNHAADALDCLISYEATSLGPLDHLLGLRIQDYIARFGPMTFVRAVASEYDLDFVVEEYESQRTCRSTTGNRSSPTIKCVPVEDERPRPNSLVR